MLDISNGWLNFFQKCWTFFPRRWTIQPRWKNRLSARAAECWSNQCGFWNWTGRKLLKNDVSLQHRKPGLKIFRQSGLYFPPVFGRNRSGCPSMYFLFLYSKIALDWFCKTGRGRVERYLPPRESRRCSFHFSASAGRRLERTGKIAGTEGETARFRPAVSDWQRRLPERMLAMDWILALFLYFPEDKREYIPAAISFSIFFIACVFTFLWIVRYSKKEEEKAKHLEEQVKKWQGEDKKGWWKGGISFATVLDPDRLFLWSRFLAAWDKIWFVFFRKPRMDGMERGTVSALFPETLIPPAIAAPFLAAPAAVSPKNMISPKGAVFIRMIPWSGDHPFLFGGTFPDPGQLWREKSFRY